GSALHNPDWSRHRRRRQVSDAWSRSRRLHHHDSARHRGIVCRQLSRPGDGMVCARPAGGIHLLGDRRDDPVADLQDALRTAAV
ncbi:MAG: Transglycosylase-associated protein, partial [uncultured Chthoniobacterales bacterium]